jgi:hypothetical protein
MSGSNGRAFSPAELGLKRSGGRGPVARYRKAREDVPVRIECDVMRPWDCVFPVAIEQVESLRYKPNPQALLISLCLDSSSDILSQVLAFGLCTTFLLDKSFNYSRLGTALASWPQKRPVRGRAIGRRRVAAWCRGGSRAARACLARGPSLSR